MKRHFLLMRLFFTLIVVGGLIQVSTHFPVLAQDSQPDTPYDLIVTPPTAYLRIKPGNTAVHAITLKNRGLAQLEITPELVDFAADGKTGQPVLSTTHTFPYLDQDKTSFDPVILQPQATAQLMLHFSVPGSAEDKEYPLSILFKGTSTEDEVRPGLTPVSGIIASNLIVLVSKNEALDSIFSVENFGVAPAVDSLSSISFAPLVKNNTFAAAVASGSATVSNWKGKEVAQFEISPSVILGYSTKLIHPLSPNGANQDLGETTFTYDSPFLIGPYTITLLLPSGSGEQIQYIEHKMIVWAAPFALLIAGAIACFALAAYYFFRKRNPFY